MLKIHINLIKNLNFCLNFLAFAHQKQKFPKNPKPPLNSTKKTKISLLPKPKPTPKKFHHPPKSQKTSQKLSKTPAVIASYFSQKQHDDNFLNGVTTTLSSSVIITLSNGIITTLSSSVMKTLSKWRYGYSFKRLANFLRFEV